MICDGIEVTISDKNALTDMYVDDMDSRKPYT